MTLQAGIILGGQTPDILGAMDKGRQMAADQIALNRQNALAELYRTQGAGIAAGDQNALNALAGMDPMAALGVQGEILGQQSQKQEMAFSAERMQMARDEGKRMAAEALAKQAASLTAEQLAAEKEQITKGLSGAAFFYQNKDKAGYEAFLAQNGMDPAEYPFEEFPAHAAMFEGALEAMDQFAPPKPAEPQSGAGKLAADLAAGLITTEQYNAELARTAPKGSKISFDPATGAMTIEEGVGVAGAGGAKVGDVYNPNEVQNVIGMIDSIAADPNLDRVVGPVEGGGGNNIDDLGTVARAYYGGEGTALIERIGQLQSNAWLSARAMLKGGGAITDYESRKAEAAVARLSRAKSEKEFRQALKDLRDAITDGEAKLRGGSTAPAADSNSQPAPAAPPAGATTFEDAWSKY